MNSALQVTHTRTMLVAASEVTGHKNKDSLFSGLDVLPLTLVRGDNHCGSAES